MRFLFFLGFLLVGQLAAAEPPAAVKQGPEPVDFTLPDLDGKPVSLSDFRGKWVVVNFWATWCPPCLEEIPELIELHEQNRDRLVVIGVDYEEVNLEYLREFVESHMMTYPVLRIDPIPITPLGQVIGLPTTYIISPEGISLARQEGPVTRKAIEGYIDRKQKELTGSSASGDRALLAGQ